MIREALREEVRAIEERRLARKLDEVSTRVKGKISEKDLIQAVRAGREER